VEIALGWERFAWQFCHQIHVEVRLII